MHGLEKGNRRRQEKTEQGSEGFGQKNDTANEKEAQELKKKNDIPLWSVLVVGAILMVTSFAVVFLMVSGERAGAQKGIRLEEWEYWGDKFNFKIAYNTSEPVVASRNSVQVGRGCTLQINNTIVSQGKFAEKVREISKRSGDIVIENSTMINSTSAYFQTALTRVNAYYCSGRLFWVTAGKYCKFDIISASCQS